MNKEESIAYYSQLAVKAARDADAFTELYEYFFPRVYNFLFAKVQNTAVADDLVSMVFMKAYTNLPNYNQAKAAFSTWLFNIASHALTDYYRSSVNKKEAEWDDIFDPAASPDIEPEKMAMAKEMNAELFEAINALDERSQKVVILKYWSDLNNKEIAETLGLSASNVGVILFRAMGELKKRLEKPEEM